MWTIANYKPKLNSAGKRLRLGLLKTTDCRYVHPSISGSGPYHTISLLLSWPCFWNGSCFFRLCRHYQKEAKDKRICAAHQATAFCCPVSFFFWFSLFFWWLLHCFLGFFVSWAKNKLCDRCDNDSSRRRRSDPKQRDASFQGPEESRTHCKKISQKAGQELSKWQRRVKTRSSLLIRKESLKAYLEIRLYL